MSAPVTCPVCHAAVAIGEGAAGLPARCPSCQAALPVPEPNRPAAEGQITGAAPPAAGGSPPSWAGLALGEQDLVRPGSAPERWRVVRAGLNLMRAGLSLVAAGGLLTGFLSCCGAVAIPAPFAPR